MRGRSRSSPSMHRSTCPTFPPTPLSYRPVSKQPSRPPFSPRRAHIVSGSWLGPTATPEASRSSWSATLLSHLLLSMPMMAATADPALGQAVGAAEEEAAASRKAVAVAVVLAVFL